MDNVAPKAAWFLLSFSFVNINFPYGLIHSVDKSAKILFGIFFKLKFPLKF